MSYYNPKENATERIHIRVTKTQKEALQKAVAAMPSEHSWERHTITEYLLNLHYAEEVRKLQQPLPDTQETP